MPEANVVVLVGRAGANASLKTVGDGEVASFPLATHRYARRGSGEPARETDWHTIDIWGRRARGAITHVKTGKLVFVRGELRSHVVEHEGRRFHLTTVVADKFDTVPETADAENDVAEVSPEADRG